MTGGSLLLFLLNGCVIVSGCAFIQIGDVFNIKCCSSECMYGHESHQDSVDGSQSVSESLFVYVLR